MDSLTGDMNHMIHSCSCDLATYCCTCFSATIRYPSTRTSSLCTQKYCLVDMSSENSGKADGIVNGHSKEGAALGRSETISSISLTPEQFDRLYLQPQNNVAGDLRKRFGNPTPVGLGGFLLALTPLVMQFMGWRGTIAANGLPTL